MSIHLRLLGLLVATKLRMEVVSGYLEALLRVQLELLVLVVQDRLLTVALVGLEASHLTGGYLLGEATHIGLTVP